MKTKLKERFGFTPMDILFPVIVLAVLLIVFWFQYTNGRIVGLGTEQIKSDLFLLLDEELTGSRMADIYTNAIESMNTTQDAGMYRIIPSDNDLSCLVQIIVSEKVDEYMIFNMVYRRNDQSEQYHLEITELDPEAVIIT